VSVEVCNEKVNITSAKRTAHFFLLFTVPEFNQTIAAKNMSAIRLHFFVNVTIADSAVLGVYLGSHANLLESAGGDKRVSRKHFGNDLDESLHDGVFPGNDE